MLTKPVPVSETAVLALSAPKAGVGAFTVSVGVASFPTDADFKRARLSSPISNATWVQWLYDWTAPAGDWEIAVRATDGKGSTQTSDQSPPAPDGARGQHTIRVNVA